MAQPVTNLLINGLNPVTVGGTGTAVKIFPYVPGASIGVASTRAGVLFIPGNGEANAQRLSVRAGGNITFGGDLTSPAVTIGLYPVTFSATVVSGLSCTVVGATPIFSNTFAASADVSSIIPWALTADLEGDGLLAQQGQASQPQFGGSGLVQLLSGAIVMDGTNASATPALVSSLSGVNMNAAIPYGLAVGITFSISGAGNSASMYQFDLQQ